MSSRDKLILVAGNVDDSIKSITPVYDITIYPTFLKFEEFINGTPIVIDSIIILERELQFTSANMARILSLLAEPFLKLTGKLVYLISPETSAKAVQSFIDENDIKNFVFYQGDLNSQFIANVISGVVRDADEEETEIVTYRVRATEYAVSQGVKKYESDKGDYITDEEELMDIPDLPEPQTQIPDINILSNTYYFVGEPSYERTLLSFIVAQYLSLNGKTLIVESDVEYHRLSDMVLRANVKYEFYYIDKFFENPTNVLNEIKMSNANLIVLGIEERYKYDYIFLFDLLWNNLQGYINYFIKECDFREAPYSQAYNIVCANTVPDVIKCCQQLMYDIDENNVNIISVRTNRKNECNLTSTETAEMFKAMLDKDYINAQVVELTGLCLKGDESIYDIFSIIGRGNERQG